MTRLIAILLFVLFVPDALAAENLRIGVQELAALMRQQPVVVLDARPSVEYGDGHLPNARSLPFSSTFEDLNETGRVLPIQKAQALFSGVGLNRDDLVVVYDSGILMHAARLLWTLEVYGHRNVRILDGGIKAWQLAGLPITEEPARFSPSQYVPSIDPVRLATRFTTLIASHKPDAYVILDARAEPHYQGLASEARRFGHIPEARSIAVASNLTDDGLHLKPLKDLARLYSDVPKSKKIITYCSVGLASSLEYMILRELGYDVANYDASWKEWGNDPALPVVNPALKHAQAD